MLYNKIYTNLFIQKSSIDIVYKNKKEKVYNQGR